jgi:hypothetical protein
VPRRETVNQGSLSLDQAGDAIGHWLERRQVAGGTVEVEVGGSESRRRRPVTP